MSSRSESRALERETDDENFAIDNAFLKACKRCGIDPKELQSKPLSSFEEKGLPQDVAVRRFNNHQESRIRKLHMVVSERKKILTDDEAVLVPHPPAPKTQNADEDTNSDRGTPRRQAPQRDVMLQRAKQMRKHWTHMNKRQAHHKEFQEQQKMEQEKRAAQFAEKERKEKEDREEMRLMLHKANMEQLQKRWERDESLAQARQTNLEAEYEARKSLHDDHSITVDSARKRRTEHLEKTAYSRGKNDDTVARLDKARKIREEHNEKVRESAQKALDHAEERRKEHTISRFLRQVDLANQAIEERSKIEEVLERAQKLDVTRRKQIAKKMNSRKEGADELRKSRESEHLQKIDSMSKNREDRQTKAHEKRKEDDEKAARIRAEKKEEQRLRAKEREERRRIDSLLKQEDCQAKNEHRKGVLTRVARCAEALQEERMSKQEAKMAKAEERRKQWKQQLSNILHTEEDLEEEADPMQ